MAVCCGVLAVRVHGGVCPRRPGGLSDRHSRLSLNGSRSRSALWGPLCLTPHPQVSPVLPSSLLVRPQYNWAPSVCGRVPVTERTPATDRREGSGCPRAPQGPPRRRCPLGFGRCPKALPPHQPPADSDGPPRRPSFPTLSPGPRMLRDARPRRPLSLLIPSRLRLLQRGPTLPLWCLELSFLRLLSRPGPAKGRSAAYHPECKSPPAWEAGQRGGRPSGRCCETPASAA